MQRSEYLGRVQVQHKHIRMQWIRPKGAFKYFISVFPKFFTLIPIYNFNISQNIYDHIFIEQIPNNCRLQTKQQMTIVSKIIKFLLKLLQTKYIYNYTFIEQTMINCTLQNMNICLWNKLQIIVNYGRLIFFIFLIMNNIFEYCFQNEKEIYTKYIYDYTFIEKNYD